jgi:hypothetical protein
VKDATTIWKSERCHNDLEKGKMPQRFRKVKNMPNYHRKATMGATALEHHKRKDMSPICAILLNVTKADEQQ